MFFNKIRSFNLIDQKNKVIPETELVLRCTLQWPGGAPTSLRRSVALLFCILPISLIIPQFAFVFAHMDDLKLVIDCLCTILGNALSNFKQFTVFNCTKDLRMLIDVFQNEWDSIKDSNDERIQEAAKSAQKFSRRFTIAYTNWYVILVIMFAINPLIQYCVYRLFGIFPDFVIELPYKLL